MSARALQNLVVFAHHGCAFIDSYFASGALTDDERACFRAVDPRAFRSDGERQHRIIAAVIAELPVSCAIAGLDAVYGLFHDVEGFGAVVLRRLPLVVRFAERLEGTVGDMARIEGAIARARRRQPRGIGYVRAAGVEVVDVGEQALRQWQNNTSSLGDDVVGCIVGGQRLPRIGDDLLRVPLLIEPAEGAFAIAGSSPSLSALLRALEAPSDEAGAIIIARQLGCDDDDEARALLNDLLVDGLLARL